MMRAAYIAGSLLLLGALPALALAAQDVKPSPAAPVATSTDEPFPWPDFLDVRPLPGQYQMIMTIEAFDLPFMDGADPNILGDTTETGEYCVTDETESFDWLGDIGGENCTQTSFSQDGGEFAMTLQCRDDFGPDSESTIRISGSATPEALDMLLSMRTQDPNMGKVSVAMRFDLQRTGDCAG